jgi:hypothetical protein
MLVHSMVLAAGAAMVGGLSGLETVSPTDAAAGWKHMTGSDAVTRWRGFKQTAFPAKGWTVKDGVLSIGKGGGGGDLVSVDTYADLELEFEFKLGEKSNSGIMWRVDESADHTFMTGAEYQLLEDATFGAKPTDSHSCAAMYDLYSPAEGKTMKPAGEWNSGRLRLRNGVIQHWLNGSKVVEARLFGDDGKPTKEWADKIANSKFKDWKGFGVLPKGMIAIQDHGDTDLAMRNVRARDLAAPLPGEVKLFNGKDMTGWKAVLPSGGTMADAWSVRDGAIICKGQPIGYIRTEEKYTNYVLRLQWRFDPAKGAGNSGVLLRMIAEDKVWPKSVEAQLQSGAAGDFWNIDTFTMTADAARTKGRNTKRDPKAGEVERPLGEWNEYEIIVDKGLVVLKVNGVEVNRAVDVAQEAGYICLQSEGAEIHFRDIRLVPLK